MWQVNLVLTAVFLKLLRTPLTLIDPEDEDIKILKKLGKYLPQAQHNIPYYFNLRNYVFL